MRVVESVQGSRLASSSTEVVRRMDGARGGQRVGYGAAAVGAGCLFGAAEKKLAGREACFGARWRTGDLAGFNFSGELDVRRSS